MMRSCSSLIRPVHLCGVGELGEIHVRTPYLAQGYLGDDALTRDRFIINPFTHKLATGSTAPVIWDVTFRPAT